MILAETTPENVTGTVLQWATLVGVLIGIAAVVWRSGRLTRDIEHNADQLERLRLIVEELTRAQTASAIASAGNFSRIEAEMRALLHRIDRLEAGNGNGDQDGERRPSPASRR